MSKLKQRKVAVIGGGACGLAVAYYLSRSNIKVDIFESSDQLGGLGSSYQVSGVPTEKFVHHLFSSDRYFIELAKELGLKKNLHFKKSKDAIFINNKIYPFSTAIDLIKFNQISLFSRLRTGLVVLFLKKTKKYQRFEQITAEKWIKNFFGKDSYLKIWQPLLVSKFGVYAKNISMTWFWARVYSRTPKLGYFDGGYADFFEKLYIEIVKQSGNFYLNHPVTKIGSMRNGRVFIITKNRKRIYDAVISTTPPSVFDKIVPELNGTSYSKKLKLKKMISATSLNLVLKKSFMKYYWLNVNQENFPFLVLIEHNNLINSTKYKNNTVLYIGNYLSHKDKRFSNSAEKNLSLYLPFLKKINPKFNRDWIVSCEQFNALYAQPVVNVGYKNTIPSQKTPIKNLYLCSMAQIYPFDRGTNYAIRDAQSVAGLVARSLARKS